MSSPSSPWFDQTCKDYCDHYASASQKPWCPDQSSADAVADCVVKNFNFCAKSSGNVTTAPPAPPTIPTAPPVPPTIPTAPPVPPTIPTAPPVPPTIPTAPPVPPTIPTAPVPPTPQDDDCVFDPADVGKCIDWSVNTYAMEYDLPSSMAQVVWNRKVVETDEGIRIQRQKLQELYSKYPEGTRQFIEAGTVRRNAVVEAVTEGNANNPVNVRRVEAILSANDFDKIFPVRHHQYSYLNFLKGVAKFPTYCRTYNDGRDSDAICRKLLATSFAHWSQETGAHWSTMTAADIDSDHKNAGASYYPGKIPEHVQGLYFISEFGCSETGSSCEYCSIRHKYDELLMPCAKDGGAKKYFGRGAKQLSYNYNYGPFSRAIMEDGFKLIREPQLVANTWLNLASAIWFAIKPQSPKPSMLSIADGSYTPSAGDLAKGITAGFGATINVINGAVECNKGGSTDIRAANRITSYKAFAEILHVDIPADEELDCARQGLFGDDSNAKLEQYFENDWKSGCKIVGYQTTWEASIPGAYESCVNLIYGDYTVKVNGQSFDGPSWSP
ncbi:MAG: hypothetical protein KVP17_003482 [Porospora cf. gigantea B]|nr:MAG: hypothetical protein KVP17_003482 [Porospora cf. gigantea B]